MYGILKESRHIGNDDYIDYEIYHKTFNEIEDAEDGILDLVNNQMEYYKNDNINHKCDMVSHMNGTRYVELVVKLDMPSKFKYKVIEISEV